MLSEEDKMKLFFTQIGTKKKQQEFLDLIRRKNIFAEDLQLILQTIKATDTGWHSEIDQLKSAKGEIVIVTTVNKGAGTKESPILQVKQYWTVEGEFIGEVASY